MGAYLPADQPMLRMRAIAATLCSVIAIAACSGRGTSTDSENTLNVANWGNFIAPDTVANFERETGIKVRYSTFETDAPLETKLLTGHTDYDIVVPSDIS